MKTISWKTKGGDYKFIKVKIQDVKEMKGMPTEMPNMMTDPIKNDLLTGSQ